MSVFFRFARRLAMVAAVCALLCGLCGCSALEDKLQQGGVYVRDLLLNSISRFPEGSANHGQQPEDMTLPPEFIFSVPQEPQAVGIVSEDVNLRSGPDAEYDHLGSLLAGTEVKIYHQLLLDNSPWGLTESGWISMNYVQLNDPALAVCAPQTDEKTCLIVIPELDVRTGPGWQYPSADIRMEAYTTHPVQAQSGAWVKLEQGWVSKDGVYLEGTVPPRTGTVTGSELNVRTGPGTQYKVVDKLLRNETVTVFHQVAVNDKYWGYTSIGWISMSYVKLEKLESGFEGEPEDPQPSPRKGIVDTAILGQWQNAVVTTDGTSLVFLGRWLFNEDGSFSYTADDAYHYYGKSTAVNTASEEDLTELCGMYTYDGSVLTLFITGDPNVAEEELPYICVANVTIDAATMGMTSGESAATLHAGTRDTVASQLLKK